MRRLAFIAAIAVQLVIVALVPVKKIRASWSGREIRLATAQYDPYDFMRGYYVNLNFEVARVAGLEEGVYGRNERVFTVIEAGTRGIWHPVAAYRDRSEVPPGAVFLAGRGNSWRVEYGIERFYMPEERRQEVNDAIAAAGNDTEAFIGVVKLDEDGNALLTAIEVEGRRFEF